MLQIRPTGPFLYVEFISRSTLTLVLPQGQRDPDGDVVIKAVGPEVPKDQGFEVGARVLLRGDAKIFAAPTPTGQYKDKQGPACIDYRSIMAVVTGEPDATPTLPDGMLQEALAAVNGDQKG